MSLICRRQRHVEPRNRARGRARASRCLLVSLRMCHWPLPLRSLPLAYRLICMLIWPPAMAERYRGRGADVERDTRTCRRGSQGARGGQGARGLPMVAERVVEQDLPQCAATAPRPRCRPHVVIVRAGRHRRGGSSIAGRAAGHDVWPDDAGLKLCTLPPGRRLRGRRAAPLHLRSSAAGI